MISCEPGLRVNVRGDNPPVFRINGDDSIHLFFVCPELPEAERNAKNAIWQIVPDREYQKSLPLDITYGVVPEGFKQVTPENDVPPSPLEPGMRYTYHFVRGFGGGGGAFIIRDGKAVPHE
jgi:hypothetical protein